MPLPELPSLASSAAGEGAPTDASDNRMADTSPPMTWHPRPADVERFTCGDCHILARAIQKRTGWPIYTFFPEGDADYYNGAGGVHAFVMMPDGRGLDVDGPQDLNAFRSKWDSTADLLPVPWSLIRREWMQGYGPEFGHYSYRRAGIIAERLLAAL